MKCINCGIAVSRVQRHVLSSLSMPAQTTLTRWLAIKLPEDEHVCHPCFLLLTSEAADERVLGHTMVCLECGQSVRDKRYHLIESDSPLLLNYSLTLRPQELTKNYVCHRCWTKTSRKLLQDSSRKETVLTSDNIEQEDALIPVVSEPSNLSPPRASVPTCSPSQITLLNYKRASNTSSHCIFSGCRKSAHHLIPKFIKRNLLNDYNFFIPHSSRVCESHLNANQWDELPQNITTLSSFNVKQIEDMFKLLKSTNEFINFEKIHEMPNHVCHYWTGLTVSEFLNFLDSLHMHNIHKPKTALGIYLTKLRNGDSNRRLSAIFNVSRSTINELVKKVKICIQENES